MYLTPILEFSPDPLSDTTPTWTAVTSSLLEAEWSAGIQREGDDPTPGSARFRLHDQTRQFEPDFAAGAFYPNVVPDRRFRWRITSSAVTYDGGVWFSQVFEPSWPDRATGQQSQVSCGDGLTVLALDDLVSLDPPEAETYEDVANHDGPWGFWPLNDAEGTRATSRVLTRFRGKGKKRRKVKRRRGTNYNTAAEVEAVSGPTGTYKNTPLLGVPGLVVGEADTAVEFRSSGTEWVRVPLETDDLVKQRVTLEALVKPTAASVDGSFLTGPVGSGGGPIWGLQQVTASNDWRMFVVLDGGGTLATVSGGTPTAGVTTHVVGTWDGTTIRLYQDGVEVASGSAARTGTVSVGASPAVQIGSGVTGSSAFNGVIAKAAVYEYALSAERIMAHYDAAQNRGAPQEDAFARISTMGLSSLWSVVGSTADRDVQPVMFRGQPRIDELAETLHALGPKAQVFYTGDGDLRVLGRDWETESTAYSTVQAVFGNASGEVPFDDIGLVSDDDTYNAVLASHESGESVEVSTGAVPRRVNTEWTDVLLVEHNEVESLAGHVLDFYSVAQFRPERLELSGVDASARLQILSRQVGDMIRIKHRPRGTGAIVDRVCNIIGFEKRLDAETGNLTCTWYLSRGFNAATNVWRAGVVGFSEAGSTTVAG